jgi:hypothetical protein
VMPDRVLRRVVRVHPAVRVELDDHQHPARPKPSHEALSGQERIVKVLVGMCSVNSAELFLCSTLALTFCVCEKWYVDRTTFS